MIYKEFKDIYKQVLITLSFLLIIPAIQYSKLSLSIQSARTGAVSNMGYSVGHPFYFCIFASILIFLSGILGLTLFGREFKDNSFEYLFSTPMGKGTILIQKIIPRLIVLLSLIIIYSVLYSINFNDFQEYKSIIYILIKPGYLILWTVFYFFINLFSSIFKQKNWIALINLLTIYALFIIPFALKKILMKIIGLSGTELSLTGYSFIIGFLIMLIILGLGFMNTYKKLDLREQFFTGNKFAKWIIPVEIVLLSTGLFVLFY